MGFERQYKTIITKIGITKLEDIYYYFHKHI